jgi:hypothetical protein
MADAEGDVLRGLRKYSVVFYFYHIFKIIYIENFTFKIIHLFLLLDRTSFYLKIIVS